MHHRLLTHVISSRDLQVPSMITHNNIRDFDLLATTACDSVIGLTHREYPHLVSRANPQYPVPPGPSQQASKGQPACIVQRPAAVGGPPLPFFFSPSTQRLRFPAIQETLRILQGNLIFTKHRNPALVINIETLLLLSLSLCYSTGILNALPLNLDLGLGTWPGTFDSVCLVLCKCLLVWA